MKGGNKMKDLSEMLKEKYGVVFNNQELLKEAFTHSSYVNEHRQLKLKHNERLEFLGDAVLEISVSEFLFHYYPQWSEGQLTRLRAKIVCEPSLANYSKTSGFDKHVLLGRGEETMNGRKRPALLADLFEAFIGALFLDQGMDAAKNFIQLTVLDSIKEDAFSHAMDYKTLLQEELQKNGDILIQYIILKDEGPSHAKFFEVAVKVKGQHLGIGTGTSKKSAEQAAAQQALKALVSQGK